MNHRRAFTLVELLLVVTIVAILVALLLPRMSKMRAASRGGACAAVQRQLANAFVMYVQENHRRSFVYPGNSGQASFDNFWMSLLEKFSGSNDNLRICPEATIRSDKVFGTARLAWSGHNHPPGYWINSGGDFHYGSFAINGFMYHKYTAGWISLKSSLPWHNVPLFADAMWVDGWPSTTDAPAPNFDHPYAIYEATGVVPSQMARFCVDRHIFSINVSFADGSTRTVPLGDLWKLKWSTIFSPGTYNPGI